MDKIRETPLYISTPHSQQKLNILPFMKGKKKVVSDCISFSLVDLLNWQLSALTLFSVIQKGGTMAHCQDFSQNDTAYESFIKLFKGTAAATMYPFCVTLSLGLNHTTILKPQNSLSGTVVELRFIKQVPQLNAVDEDTCQ